MAKRSAIAAKKRFTRRFVVTLNSLLRWKFGQPPLEPLGQRFPLDFRLTLLVLGKIAQGENPELVLEAAQAVSCESNTTTGQADTPSTGYQP